MKILFVAGFGPIVREMGPALAFYGAMLGLPLEGDADYQHTTAVAGVKHFALWPLAGAAQSCFGSAQWPDGLPVPQGWIEYEVDDLAAATAEVAATGHRLLVSNRGEPWGQTVSRLLGPEGLLVGLTHTPGLRSDAADGTSL